jgi:hypothetical protein
VFDAIDPIAVAALNTKIPRHSSAEQSAQRMALRVTGFSCFVLPQSDFGRLYGASSGAIVTDPPKLGCGGKGSDAVRVNFDLD